MVISVAEDDTGVLQRRAASTTASTRTRSSGRGAVTRCAAGTPSTQRH